MKESKKEPKNHNQLTTVKMPNIWLDGIIGIWKLLVVASIFISTATILLGTNDYKTWLLALPMVIWALIETLKTFYKANK